MKGRAACGLFVGCGVLACVGAPGWADSTPQDLAQAEYAPGAQLTPPPAAGSSASIQGLNTPDLHGLQNLKSTAAPEPSTEFAQLRLKTQWDTATALGIQAGVQWRYQQIDAVMIGMGDTLDQVFEFKPLMIDDGRVIPPVIDQTNGSSVLPETFPVT